MQGSLPITRDPMPACPEFRAGDPATDKSVSEESFCSNLESREGNLPFHSWHQSSGMSTRGSNHWQDLPGIDRAAEPVTVMV